LWGFGLRGDFVISDVMRRLFSTFADGLPGAGLLILRLFLGGALMLGAIGAVLHGSVTAAIANVLAAIAGIRTFLNYFLEKDIAKAAEESQAVQEAISRI